MYLTFKLSENQESVKREEQRVAGAVRDNKLAGLERKRLTN